MPTQLCDPEIQLMELASQLDMVEPFTVEDIQGTGDVLGGFRATEKTKSLLGRRPGTVAGVPEAWFTACCCCCCCSAAT